MNDVFDILIHKYQKLEEVKPVLIKQLQLKKFIALEIVKSNQKIFVFGENRLLLLNYNLKKIKELNFESPIYIVHKSQNHIWIHNQQLIQVYKEQKQTFCTIYQITGCKYFRIFQNELNDSKKMKYLLLVKETHFQKVSIDLRVVVEEIQLGHHINQDIVGFQVFNNEFALIIYSQGTLKLIDLNKCVLKQIVKINCKILRSFYNQYTLSLFLQTCSQLAQENSQIYYLNYNQLETIFFGTKYLKKFEPVWPKAIRNFDVNDNYKVLLGIQNKVYFYYKNCLITIYETSFICQGCIIHKIIPLVYLYNEQYIQMLMITQKSVVELNRVYFINLKQIQYNYYSNIFQIQQGPNKTIISLNFKLDRVQTLDYSGKVDIPLIINNYNDKYQIKRILDQQSQALKLYLRDELIFQEKQFENICNIRCKDEDTVTVGYMNGILIEIQTKNSMRQLNKAIELQLVINSSLQNDLKEVQRNMEKIKKSNIKLKCSSNKFNPKLNIDLQNLKVYVDEKSFFFTEEKQQLKDLIKQIEDKEQILNQYYKNQQLRVEDYLKEYQNTKLSVKLQNQKNYLIQQKNLEQEYQTIVQNLQKQYLEELQIKNSVLRRVQQQKKRIDQVKREIVFQNKDILNVKKQAKKKNFEAQCQKNKTLIYKQLNLQYLVSKEQARIKLIQQKMQQLQAEIEQMYIQDKKKSKRKEEIQKKVNQIIKKQKKIEVPKILRSSLIYTIQNNHVQVQENGINKFKNRYIQLEKVQRQTEMKFNYVIKRKHKLDKNILSLRQKVIRKDKELVLKNKGCSISNDILKSLKDQISVIKNEAYDKTEITVKLKQILKIWKQENYKRFEYLAKFSSILKQFNKNQYIETSKLYKQLTQISIFQIHETIQNENKFLLEADTIFKQSFFKLNTIYEKYQKSLKADNFKLMINNSSEREEIKKKKQKYQNLNKQINKMSSYKKIDHSKSETKIFMTQVNRKTQHQNYISSFNEYGLENKTPILKQKRSIRQKHQEFSDSRGKISSERIFSIEKKIQPFLSQKNLIVYGGSNSKK